MKSTIYVIATVLALATFFPGAIGHAEMCRVKANVSVTTFEDATKEDRLDISVEVFDSNKKRPPDFVIWVKVKMPDGSELNLTNNWAEWWNDYGAYIPASQLAGGVIQSGQYKITVKDRTGKQIKVFDKINAAATLTPPSITSPAEGESIGSLTPTITWTPVSGAEVYRLHLIFCGTNGGDGPLWYPKKVPYIDGKTTHFIVPKGVLMNGRCYQTRVEALNKNSFRDHRGRSMWVQFFTP